MSKVSMGTVPNGWLIVARVQAATLNILLTILHQKAEWDKESLLQFCEEYTIMLRQYRDPGRIGKQIRKAVEETRERTEIHIKVNQDIPNTRENQLVEKTWRECLFCGLTVLKQCNSKESLLAVFQYFGDFLDALTDARHGRFNEAVFTNLMLKPEAEEAVERQKASIELLNETMHFMGRD